VAGGYDPDDMDALFYNGVDAAVVDQEVERAQSDTPSLKPWPAAVLPQLPTRFVLFRDDRFFPEEFMRGVVADRLGIEPEITPAGTWQCCRIRSNLPTNLSPRPTMTES
jgi:hypothetical protein